MKSLGSRCDHEFCWRCLEDYEPILVDGNHRHAQGCKHHRRIGAPVTDPVAVIDRLFGPVIAPAVRRRPQAEVRAPASHASIESKVRSQPGTQLSAQSGAQARTKVNSRPRSSTSSAKRSANQDVNQHASGISTQKAAQSAGPESRAERPPARNRDRNLKRKSVHSQQGLGQGSADCAVM